jgi:hypothetical protein
MMTFAFPSAAQRVAILNSLDAVSSKGLENAIVRVEYLGERNGELQPLLFTVTGNKVDWKRLRAVPGLAIGDWEEKYTRQFFTVTVEEMKDFLEAAKPFVTPTRDAESWLSLAVVAGNGEEEKAFVGSVSRQKASEFFILARNALRADPKDITIMNGLANYEAMNILQSFGCAVDLLPSVIPAKDVTNEVAVTRSGLRFDYQRHRFESTVSLKNTSNQAIRAPISVVVDLSSNISLANAHAHTCMARPEGRGFITLPIPTREFKPGQVLETLLVFEGPIWEDIDFTTKVLATPGER